MEKVNFKNFINNFVTDVQAKYCFEETKDRVERKAENLLQRTKVGVNLSFK